MSFIPNHNIDNGAVTPEKIANRMKQQAVRLYGVLKQSVTRGSKDLWQNSAGFTPQEILTALGTDAAEIVTLHQQVAAIINSVNSQDLAEAIEYRGNNTYTKNQDGTVTVNP